MTAWILYALGVSAVVTVAAALADRVVRGGGRPTRWIWAAALALSAGLPLGAGLARAAVDTGPAGTVAEAPLSSAGITPATGAADPSWWERVPWTRGWMGPALLRLWMGASAALGSLLLLVTLALHVRASRWPRIRLPQGEAFLSDRFGPALLGGVRARVVIPRWALAMGPRAVGMIMTHEDEHRRAGDANLLLGAAAVVASIPWNPLLWLQLRRLRTAVELDCDARVLARGVPAVSYAELLLSVSTRAGNRLVPWAALAAEPSLLERRLMMIVHGRESVGRGRAVLAGVLSAALVGLACGAEAPPLGPEGSKADAQFSQQLSTEMDLKAKKAAAAKPWVEGPMAAFGQQQEGGGPLILLDGERVTKADLKGLDRAAIDRVEVVKGEAAVAVFGPEAEGGVIQIFLKALPGSDPGEGP